MTINGVDNREENQYERDVRYAVIVRLRKERDTLRAELEETKAGHQRVMDALKDSHMVHVNILRGDIALSDAALLHIAKTRGIEGEQLKRDRDELQADQNELVAALERLIRESPQYGIDGVQSDCDCPFCEAERTLTRIKGETPTKGGETGPLTNRDEDVTQ